MSYFTVCQMLQGVALDFDGTIGRTMERQHSWFQYWAEQNNSSFDMSFEDFVPWYNELLTQPGGVQNVYDESGLPCDMNDRGHPVWPAYETFKTENPASFYPGMRKAIVDIAEAGRLTADPKRNRRLRMAINTSNTWRSIYPELAQEDVVGYFDSFVTHEVLEQYHGAEQPATLHKPSKVSLALILGLIDSEGAHTMHVGDTLNDLAASQKVVWLNPAHPETLITVGCAWGYEGRESLEKGLKGEAGTAHFNHIIDKPEELFPVVQQYLHE